VGGDRECAPVQLVGEKALTSWKAFRASTDLISEIDGLLVDEQLFKGESHA
jgi:hypothetical protein